jgi:biopolymer transport protein TolR
MAMDMGGKKGLVGEMNVTPMIDILLVLIIVFMIIHTSSSSSGLDALAPHPPDKPDEIPPDQTVIVQVLEAGSGRPHLLINREPVEWDGLRARLVEIYKTRAERVMFMKADRDIDFEEVANVIDTAHGAFQDMKIGLITT